MQKNKPQSLKVEAQTQTVDDFIGSSFACDVVAYRSTVIILLLVTITMDPTMNLNPWYMLIAAERGNGTACNMRQSTAVALRFVYCQLHLLPIRRYSIQKFIYSIILL